MKATSGSDRPQSGQTRIAVGETHGKDNNGCATPTGSNVVLPFDRGLSPTAIHVLSLRDNREQCADAPRSHPVPIGYLTRLRGKINCNFGMRLKTSRISR